MTVKVFKMITSCTVQRKRDVGTKETQVIEQCTPTNEECIREEEALKSTLHNPVLGIVS